MKLSTILVILGVLLGMVLVGWLALALVPVVFAVLIWAVPIILLIAGLASCLLSNKPTSLKVLWIIVIILAPLLGPLLWFLWGKKHT